MQLQLPVNIDTLVEEWMKDAIIDSTEPGRELLKVSKLHAKYLRIMTHHNLICKKLTGDYNRMKSLKFQYYSGDLNNPEDLGKYGFAPWMKKVLRNDIPLYLESDTDLQNILLKKSLHQEIVDFCGSVLKELNSRTYQIRGHIDWEKFTSGA